MDDTNKLEYVDALISAYKKGVSDGQEMKKKNSTAVPTSCLGEFYNNDGILCSSGWRKACPHWEECRRIYETNAEKGYKGREKL